MNYAMFTGNLGSDPRLFADPGKTPRLIFNVGCSQRESSGQYTTLWVGCTLFGKRADTWQSKMGKGDKILIGGPIHMYEGQDGKVRMNMNVSEIEVIKRREPVVANDNQHYPDPYAVAEGQSLPPDERIPF